MARKTRSSVPVTGETGKPVSKKEVEWGGFIEIRLTVETTHEFENWLLREPERYWTDFHEAVASGLKFGLSYDVQGDFWLATFTGSGNTLIGLDNRYCLTARGEQWQRALALLCFKHFEVASGDWGQFKTNGFKAVRFG
jgi:hypothetical protein